MEADDPLHPKHKRNDTWLGANCLSDYKYVVSEMGCGIENVIRMNHQRITRQAFPGFKRGPGRPRTDWRSTVNKDLLRMGFTREEAEVAAQNRSEWRVTPIYF